MITVIFVDTQAPEERQGLVQEELAFEAGLHRTYVSQIECCVRNPTIIIVERLAEALGVEEGELLRRPAGAQR